MPTYEYICESCEHEFEEFQSITARPLKKCPACGEPRLRRKIGAGAGIIFKGSGFYETDYRSESYKKSAKAEKDAASPKAGKSESGDGKTGDGGAKPETRSDAKPAKPAQPAQPDAAAANKSKPTSKPASSK